MEIRSGDALVVFDRDLQVVDWNPAAEELTGIPAADAIGRPCWDVLRGTDAHDSLVCHRGCSGARLLQKAWPIRGQTVKIGTADGGRRTVAMSTLAVSGENGELYMHVLRNGQPEAPGHDPAARERVLTKRQTEVLKQIAEGHSARLIAARLGLAEPTIRNHIRAILVTLGAHSQIEALANARRQGLID